MNKLFRKNKRRQKVAKGFVFKKIGKSKIEKNLAQINELLKQMIGEKRLR